MILLTTTTGPLSFFHSNVLPNAVASRGSIAIRNDAGNVGLYQNLDGLATGWQQLATAGGSTTFTAPATWTLSDNSPVAWVIGAAGDTDMLTFDTTNGAEVLVVGSTLGLRINDLSALRFGTPGTDLVMTADGANVTVTGTGSLIYNDDVVVGFGTTLANRWNLSASSFLSRLQFVGTDIIAGGATGPTRGYAVNTGNRIKNDADAGLPGSGAISAGTGNTDISFVGAAVGGNSAGVTFTTGNATSSGAGATSGSTGPMQFTTGNSDDAGSGGFFFTSGTAGTTRGNFNIVCPVIDIKTQATILQLLDDSAAAFSIDSAGATGLIAFRTSNGTESVTFRESVLTNLNLAVRDSANGSVDAGFWLRRTFPAGAGPTDVILPARTGGYRVVDAYINNSSGGGGAGTLQVQTGAGVGITNAMVPGAADVLTRATTVILANASIAGGGTVRLTGVAATTAGECWVRLEPL
jgi:hypothetical protein